tara:strand:- start:1299 stop:2423 length:1125 start_codon:yes stop_codon:yes gene_type:complete
MIPEKLLSSFLAPSRYAIVYSVAGAGFGFLNSILHIYFLGMDNAYIYFLLFQVSMVVYLTVDERHVNTTWLASNYGKISAFSVISIVSVSIVAYSSIVAFNAIDEDVYNYAILSIFLSFSVSFQNRVDAFFKSIATCDDYHFIKIVRVVSFPILSSLYALGGVLFHVSYYIPIVITLNFLVVLYLYFLVPGKSASSGLTVRFLLADLSVNAISGVMFYYITRVWSAAYISPQLYTALNFGWRFSGPAQHIIMRFRDTLNKAIGKLQLLSIIVVSIFSIVFHLTEVQDSTLVMFAVVIIVAIDRSIQSSARMFYMSMNRSSLVGERRYLIAASMVSVSAIYFSYYSALSVIMIAVSFRGLVAYYHSKTSYSPGSF